MASGSGAVWAIDIGNNSLKAIRLTDETGVVEVIGFANIRHGKILDSGGVSEAEREELIALSLRRFVEENDIYNDDLIVSVPSQNSFARFVTLPPVEKKRIPEIVRFEAAQQIPFDINDVQWDWQMMSEPDADETVVGLFAIKNEVVTSTLDYFSGEGLAVNFVQMVPMALYNYALYDRVDLMESDRQATVVIDIGADSTDLVVCTKSGVWQRCIPMGGNAFTRAIADSFKLSFEKAEKLKRTAAMSKYARQIFQAMKPVFSDLAAEIQRSLGFYTSSNSGVKLSRMIAFGGGSKMRGLMKYLGQTLQMPVERPDSFRRIGIAPGISEAKFLENVSEFGIVYGLGLQALGLGRIENNLLPRSIARSMAWASKSKHFVLAAIVLLVVAVMSFGRTFLDRVNYNSSENKSRRRVSSSVLKKTNNAKRALAAEKSRASKSEEIIDKAMSMFKYRDIIPDLYQTILATLPNSQNNPSQADLYKAYASGDVESIFDTPRKERKILFVTNMSVRFVEDLSKASFGEVLAKRGIKESSGDDKSKGDRSRDEAFLKAMGPRRRPPGAKNTDDKASPSSSGKGAVRAGFVITIAGYSPYEKLGDLLDPALVENDRSRWGVVSRMMHLSEIIDANCPFEIYEKGVASHFSITRGPVDLIDNTEMPQGIGIELEREIPGQDTTETLLIDPMTKEIISTVVERDENNNEKYDSNGKVLYEVNDNWFVLNVKFIWKDAPVEAPMDIRARR